MKRENHYINGKDFPCPCCGKTVLSQSGSFEICPVCNWEDDGQSAEDELDVRGGPNRDLSLRGARLNFNLTHAFASDLAESASQVTRILPEPMFTHQSSTFAVKVQGELLSVPHRTYHQNEPELRSLSNVQRQMVYCLYTRNFSGYIREKFLRKLLQTELAYWHAPFLLSLLGEYVIEIITVLQDNQKLLDTDIYNQFQTENPQFIGLIKNRIVSYWNEYYRIQYPDFKSYPGYQVAEALSLWSPNDLPNLSRNIAK